MYKIDRRGGGWGGSKNRSIGQARNSTLKLGWVGHLIMGVLNLQ